MVGWQRRCDPVAALQQSCGCYSAGCVSVPIKYITASIGNHTRGESVDQ
jgi:hypothetical protein